MAEDDDESHSAQGWSTSQQANHAWSPGTAVASPTTIVEPLDMTKAATALETSLPKRPSKGDMIQRHILPDTQNADPRLAAQQVQLQRAKLEDGLKKNLQHRPGVEQLQQLNILPVHASTIEPAVYATKQQLEHSAKRASLDNLLENRPGTLDLVQRQILQAPPNVHKMLTREPTPGPSDVVKPEFMPEPPPLPGWHLPYALPELSPSRISKRPSIFSLPAEVNLGSPSKLPNDNVLDGGPNSPPELGRNVDSNVERPAPMSASASSGVGKESSRFPFEFEDIDSLLMDLEGGAEEEISPGPLSIITQLSSDTENSMLPELPSTLVSVPVAPEVKTPVEHAHIIKQQMDDQAKQMLTAMTPTTPRPNKVAALHTIEEQVAFKFNLQAELTALQSRATLPQRDVRARIQQYVAPSGSSSSVLPPGAGVGKAKKIHKFKYYAYEYPGDKKTSSKASGTGSSGVVRKKSATKKTVPKSKGPPIANSSHYAAILKQQEQYLLLQQWTQNQKSPGQSSDASSVPSQGVPPPAISGIPTPGSSFAQRPSVLTAAQAQAQIEAVQMEATGGDGIRQRAHTVGHRPSASLREEQARAQQQLQQQQLQERIVQMQQLQLQHAQQQQELQEQQAEQQRWQLGKRKDDALVQGLFQSSAARGHQRSASWGGTTSVANVLPEVDFTAAFTGTFSPGVTAGGSATQLSTSVKSDALASAASSGPVVDASVCQQQQASADSIDLDDYTMRIDLDDLDTLVSTGSNHWEMLNDAEGVALLDL